MERGDLVRKIVAYSEEDKNIMLALLDSTMIVGIKSANNISTLARILDTGLYGEMPDKNSEKCDNKGGESK